MSANIYYCSDDLTSRDIESWNIRSLNKYIEQTGTSPEKHKKIKLHRRNQKMKAYRTKNRKKDREKIRELIKKKKELTKIILDLKVEIDYLCDANIVDELLEVIDSSNFEN